MITISEEQLIQVIRTAVRQAFTQEPPTADRWLDKHQAAKLLACSVSTVERMTRHGQLPSHKIGTLRRYRMSELLRQ